MEQSFQSDSTVTREGKMTRAIEQQTQKIPSLVYLALAGGAVAASLTLAGTQKSKGLANFIGLWVPSILLLGIYNKIVKVEGSDQSEKTYH